MEGPQEDSTPRLIINKAGLRVLAIFAAAVAVAAIAALVAEVGLFTSNTGAPDHPDPLTTLALVLAVLAFIVQILVFLFQTSAAAALERRSERLDAQTHRALGEIKTESAATQRALTSQFQRLLDYVVGGSPTASASSEEARDAEEAQDANPGEAGGEVEGAEVNLNVAEIERIAIEAARPRPSFVVEPNRASEEDLEISRYLREWPGREEAETAVAQLAELPPMALASLSRYATLEQRQRRSGAKVGLIRRKQQTQLTKYLIDAGLLRLYADRTALTDEGRKVVRVLPIGQKGGRPSWYEEVTAPLWKPKSP
jgi:hypothetical protein